MAFWLVFYQFWFPLHFFQDVPMHNEHSNDVLALSVASFLAWETFEDWNSNANGNIFEQHFIPGMNYPNRHLIMIRGNKKDVCFWRHANSLLYRSDVNRVDGVFFLKLLNLEHLEQAKKKLKPRGHCWNSILLYNRWLEALMKTGKVGGSHSSSHQE